MSTYVTTKTQTGDTTPPAQPPPAPTHTETKSEVEKTATITTAQENAGPITTNATVIEEAAPAKPVEEVNKEEVIDVLVKPESPVKVTKEVIELALLLELKFIGSAKHKWSVFSLTVKLAPSRLLKKPRKKTPRKKRFL
jgi:hypothetical protein